MAVNVRSLLRSTAAAMLGYAAIVLCTTLGFSPLGGIIHITAPPHIHVLATFVAVGAGVIGGTVAALIGKSRPVLHATGVLIFLAIDTVGVLLRPSPDPWWFEVGGSATLMASTVFGGILYALAKRRFGIEGQQMPSTR